MAPPILSLPGYFPITGIQAGLGDPRDEFRKVPVRMELDDWYLSQDVVIANQRALFFPAFRDFCREKATEKFSFFQIAGIHGQPRVAWDEKPGAKRGDYCTHGRTKFATWHRPYLMLFEQVIYEYMKDYANRHYTGDDRKELLADARSWRLPYWDWAAKKPDPNHPNSSDGGDYNMPRALLTDTVYIRLPKLRSYETGPYPNALYKFSMPGGGPMGGIATEGRGTGIKATQQRDPTGRKDAIVIPFDMCAATSRHPQEIGVTNSFITGVQNNRKLVQTLRNNYATKDKTGSLTESLRDAYYRLFDIREFEDFSSTASNDSRKTPTVFHNCEGLHNDMHGWCGGSALGADRLGYAQTGHMSVVEVAAFDPLFWFHHCNVDRTVAIWQALYGKSWFRNRRRDDQPGDDLRPFHASASGRYWTSNDVREIEPLGYTYPILDKTKYIKKGVYYQGNHLAAIRRELNTMYNAARSAAIKAALTANPGESGGVRFSNLRQMLAEAPPDHNGDIDRSVSDYAVNVAYKRMGLGGFSFSVHIFVGRIPDAVPYDFQDPEGSYVGEVFNFAARPTADPTDPDDDGCGNCARQGDEVATGRVVLTNALITRWKQELRHTPRAAYGGETVLASMDPRDVVPFLTANLHWRVTSHGHVIEDLERDLPSVKVSLVVGRADHYADPARMSEFYDYKPAYQVTRGRPGGASWEDGLYSDGWEWVP